MTAAEVGQAEAGWWRWRTKARPRSRHDAVVVRPDTVARAGLFIWIPVWLGVGIGGWFALKSEPGAALYAVLTAVGLIAAWTTLRSVAWAETGRVDPRAAGLMRGAAFAIGLIAAGACVAGLRAHRVDAPILAFRYYGPVEGRVIEIDRSARDRMRLTLDRVVLPGRSPERTPERVRLSLTEPGGLPEIRERVMTTGHLGPPPGPAEPGGFDFRRSAFFGRLGAVGYTRNPVLTIAPAPEGGAAALQRLRHRASAGIADGIGGQAGAVASALMTGDRSRIAESTNQVMRDSNLYHIVSISGLHMAMLAGFVYAAFRWALIGMQAARLIPLGPPVHTAAALAALVAAAGYLWLSGGGVATERAFIMVAVMLGAILADRRAISLRTVALAATMILIASPEALVTPGFQMSFAATLALILIAGPWSRVSPLLPWILRPIAMLILSSLVAGLATGPIAAAHFNRSAQYGLLANLIVVPVMGTLVMPAGVIAALLAPLGLAAPVLWVMGIGTRWMLLVAEWIAGLGGAVYAVPTPPAATLPLMGGGALIAVLVLRPGVRGIARSAGLLAVVAAVLGLALWALAERPAILIAPEGGAVGILTPEGRSLSKPANAFIADSWIEADGDTATADEAATRPGWSGERGIRTARLGEASVVHLTGKSAPDRLAEMCRPGVIIVTDADAARAPAACTLFDLGRLRETGSMAGHLKDGTLRWTTAADVTGKRLWSGG
ncbi:ComEC/Rec2 family competence protein [Paracoccus sp. Z118]|uniref:ComEC/Rec2 family competence protein n=1 Tax=Paracoccus sp. Z118 TaxID=2851017 RepID=UPI003530508E